MSLKQVTPESDNTEVTQLVMLNANTPVCISFLIFDGVLEISISDQYIS